MNDRNYEDDAKAYGEEAAKTIHELQAVIAAELQKSEHEMNKDLIRECVDWCLELKGTEINPTDDEIKEMYSRCISAAKAEQKRTKHPVVKRTVIAISAAALMIVMLCITAAGTGTPFDSFICDIRELFGLKPGETVSAPEGYLTVSTFTYHYDDIDSFYNDSAKNILCIDGLELKRKNPDSDDKPITYSLYDSTLAVFIDYENAVSLSAYLTAPPFEESVLAAEPDIKKVEVKGRSFYIFDHTFGEQKKQGVIFDEDGVYVIHAPNEEALINASENLKRIKE